MLAEAAFVAVSTPGPMRAFYQRVGTRRGKQIAIIGVARKLTVLFWHMLTRQEDYAFARPSLTAHKLRELELRAGRRTARRLSQPQIQEWLPPAAQQGPGTGDRSPGGARLPPARHRLAAREPRKRRCRDLTFLLR
jgi:hypothetical protein